MSTIKSKEPLPAERSSRKHIILKITTAAVTILIFFGAVFGAYVFGASQRTQPSSDNIETPALDEAKEEEVSHAVIDAGRPFLKTNQVKVTTALAVPNRLQAISLDSSIQDQGLTDVLANKFNEEVGRWGFGNPSTESSFIGGLSLIHLGDDWISEDNPYTGTSSYRRAGFLIDYDMRTVAAKKASLQAIESETGACANDDSKGFTISGFMRVCYSVESLRAQSVGSYHPYLQILGRGVNEGRVYILAGSIALADRGMYTEEEASEHYINFEKGQIPADTSSRAQEYVAALKQTTITFERVEN